MQTLNKISKYSFFTAGLALALSATPVNAQAFKLGETGTTPATAANNFAGQTFQFTVGGDFSGTTSSGAVLNSIKFSLDATAVPNTAIVASLFNITDNGLPTYTGTNLNTSGRIAFSTSTTVVNPDTEFSLTTLRSLKFDFTGTTELSTGKQYGVFFSAIDANNVIRRSNVDAYSGGTFYRTITGTLTPQTADSFFIVDATAVPFEFEASGGIAILGGLFLANKLRNRKQNDKTDDQA